MKVRITSSISGTRDGKPWPTAGETVEVPDAEGKSLCSAGLAQPLDARKDSVESRAEQVEYRPEGLPIEDLPVDESGVHYNDKPGHVSGVTTAQAPQAEKAEPKKAAAKKA